MFSLVQSRHPLTHSPTHPLIILNHSLIPITVPTSHRIHQIPNHLLPSQPHEIRHIRQLDLPRRRDVQERQRATQLLLPRPRRVQPLPSRPHPIDVRVVHEESRVLRGARDVGADAAHGEMARVVGAERVGEGWGGEDSAEG